MDKSICLICQLQCCDCFQGAVRFGSKFTSWAYLPKYFEYILSLGQAIIWHFGLKSLNVFCHLYILINSGSVIFQVHIHQEILDCYDLCENVVLQIRRGKRDNLGIIHYYSFKRYVVTLH